MEHLPNVNDNGYRRIRQIDYHHRIVAAAKLGRSLRQGEVVHHRDEDRSNNTPSNLMVFRTNGDHSRFHRQGDQRFLVRNGDGSWSCLVKRRLFRCASCGERFDRNERDAVTCSDACQRKHSRKVERPSKEDLHRLVWSMPTTAVAASLGVSDVAVTKWCKRYKIQKPPRGYWAKQQAGGRVD